MNLNSNWRIFFWTTCSLSTRWEQMVAEPPTRGTACWRAPGRWCGWPAPPLPPAEGAWSASGAWPGGMWCGWGRCRSWVGPLPAGRGACCPAWSRRGRPPWSWQESCRTERARAFTHTRTHAHDKILIRLCPLIYPLTEGWVLQQWQTFRTLYIFFLFSMMRVQHCTHYESPATKFYCRHG